MKLRRRDRASEEVRCVLCHDHIPSGGVTCPTCGVRFHRACHEGRNGCPTYGCEGQLQDLVLPPSSSSIEGARTLIAAGVLLVVAGLVVAAVLAIQSAYAEREEEDRAREAATRRLAAEAEAAAKQRADEQRRTEERRLQWERERNEAEQLRAQEAQQRASEARRREVEEGKADLEQRRAAMEEERREQQEKKKALEQLQRLEVAAGEHVRTVLFRELSLHGALETEEPIDQGVKDRLRAGEWVQGEIVACMARSGGRIEVVTRAPNLGGQVVFVVRAGADGGWTLVTAY